ncbi:MAG: membrane protein insertase YidC [Gammaproteobacteria bacterium]
MDIQRTGLLAILGILTYVLFLQWNRYAETANEVSQVPTTAQPVNSQPAVANEIPSGSGLTQAPVAPLESNATGDHIVVSTPLSDITIALTGGDISQVLLKEFPVSLKNPDNPIALLDKEDRTYIAQSGLVGTDGPDASSSGRPIYKAEQDRYRIEQPTDISIRTMTQMGLVVTKTFYIDPTRYDIKVTHTIENTSDTSKTVSPFVQLKRDNSEDPSIQNSMGMQAFLGYALRTADERYRKISFTDFETATAARALNTELKNNSVSGGYLALLQHYFTSAWVPADDQTHLYSFRTNQDGHFIGSIISPDLMISAGETKQTSATLYVGPKDQDTLELLSPGLELVVDYGWLWFIAQPLFWLLKFIQTYVGNWGFAIILVTVIVKAAFFQLSAAAYKSMAKMRKFTPEITRMRELYGDDRQRMSKEMMDLYKREKINPLGGCLPILVQMPVFIALYWVLMESVELRQAPFILWINDLSVKDPYFILPLLMGVSMYIQTSLNPTPPDPMQAKIMKYMPVAFTFFFLWFPAGLVLYWVINNILSIAQQWVITKSIEKADHQHS